MKLEDICTSYEVSKKLEEVGFRTETCFWWKDWFKDLLYIDVCTKPSEAYYLEGGKALPAYTFEQLWNELPDYLDGRAVQWEVLGEYEIRCVDDHSDSFIEDFYTGDRSLTSAAAEALIWCIQEGYYKLDKNNKKILDN